MATLLLILLICNIVIASRGDIDLQMLFNRMEFAQRKITRLERQMTEKISSEKAMLEKMSRLEMEVASLRSWKSKFETIIKGQNRHERLLLPQTTKEPRVAFSSYMSASFKASSFGIHRELVYDGIECNIGNGYDNFTGTFRAPVSGTYAFTWTVSTSGEDSGEMGVELLINNKIHGATYADSKTASDEDSATGFLIHSINSGDIIYTRSQDSRQTGTIRSNRYARTTFSGWLLFQ